ncbi:uncharacterized protein LOC119706663 [Motacilla alba alba]|uniref:uncharacterized protein LOC119706663 n=1 Tax=Motacilla alba alba TaxID=1094192 RepID=UPI0018D56306|nr:uncharacterized protein LOC119706663 [Motacilla alba alba]
MPIDRGAGGTARHGPCAAPHGSGTPGSPLRAAPQPPGDAQPPESGAGQGVRREPVPGVLCPHRRDPPGGRAGLREFSRVVPPGARVLASRWDGDGRRQPDVTRRRQQRGSERPGSRRWGSFGALPWPCLLSLGRGEEEQAGAGRRAVARGKRGHTDAWSRPEGAQPRGNQDTPGARPAGSSSLDVAPALYQLQLQLQLQHPQPAGRDFHLPVSSCAARKTKGRGCEQWSSLKGRGAEQHLLVSIKNHPLAKFDGVSGAWARTRAAGSVARAATGTGAGAAHGTDRAPGRARAPPHARAPSSPLFPCSSCLLPSPQGPQRRALPSLAHPIDGHDPLEPFPCSASLRFPMAAQFGREWGRGLGVPQSRLSQGITSHPFPGPAIDPGHLPRGPSPLCEPRLSATGLTPSLRPPSPVPGAHPLHHPPSSSMALTLSHDSILIPSPALLCRVTPLL